MSDQPSIDLSETESVKSDTKSTKSSASVTKPSNIKPPSTTTRIGRPCCAGHLPKPGLPPMEPKSKSKKCFTHTKGYKVLLSEKRSIGISMTVLIILTD